jgi:uncharacterized protein YecE (DUF72 family)
MAADIYIGTSGWHYNHWLGTFYPPEVKGYYELKHHAQHFDTVENNSSFYRVAGSGTYKTWDRMTPEGYVFSIKLNKFITHTHRLVLNDEVRERIATILDSTQTLGQKVGAIVIQLPASFKYDLPVLQQFLAYFTAEVRRREHPFDMAIEFRHKRWLIDEVYKVLKDNNVALVAGQSSRWPEERRVTADVVYIRMHGPRELFSSSYTSDELLEWADYIRKVSKRTKRVYIYFNNDFHGYALDNAKELMRLLDIKSINPSDSLAGS